MRMSFNQIWGICVNFMSSFVINCENLCIFFSKFLAKKCWDRTWENLLKISYQFTGSFAEIIFWGYGNSLGYLKSFLLWVLWSFVEFNRVLFIIAGWHLKLGLVKGYFSVCFVWRIVLKGFLLFWGIFCLYLINFCRFF